MLVGLFLRHFKTYKGARYFSFGTKELNNFNLFIGQNGIGKSSILEALDYFFNNSEFIMHHSETKKEAFVSPLFLIPKDKLNKFDTSVQNIIPIISEAFYSIKQEDSSNYNRYSNFFNQLSYLQNFRETHFLLAIASHPYSDDDKPFFTFNDVIIAKLRESDNETNIIKTVKKLKNDMQKIYSFQYIPVETSLADFLRLESKGMQDLMSENIKKHIEKLLNDRLLETIGSNNKKRAMLDILNDKLEEFISATEATIQNIDSNYSFNKDFNARTKLTAYHLTDIIIENYFSKRRLKLNNKPIDNLSAGERKKALIDIAYAFLTQDRDLNQDIILAIDEPESSLHISMCYNQFSRLLELAKDYNIQMFVTTHWYGSLPIMDKGSLYHIHEDNNGKIVSEFSFKNYFQENGDHPDDIHFKSFYDLVSSIISSLRLHKKHWLIVESTDDKNYIQKHLSNDILKNLIILPVGGSNIVLNIYNYLFVPLSQKSEVKEINNKVICLVDTDFQALPLTSETKSDNKKKNLIIRRLQYYNDEIRLEKITNNNRTPTEIEECLNPLEFYTALKTVIENRGDEEIQNIFDNFVFDSEAKCSFIAGDNAMIYLRPDHTLEQANPQKYKMKIHDFVNKHKSFICDEYCKLNVSKSPNWITELEKLFKE